MLGILADANSELQVDLLLAVCRGQGWRTVWDALDIVVHDFKRLRIDKATPDDVLWRTCQQLGIVLLTANRNQVGPDSLQETIVREGGARSLPVITIADPKRVQIDGAYRQRAANRLMEFLFEIDQMRGTGRLYVP